MRSEVAFSVGIAGIAWLTTAVAAHALDWQRYTNARFGASAEVPMDLFTAGREPDNGDGQSLRSSDGSATVLIYGSDYRGAYDSFTAYRNTTLADERQGGLDITYKASGRDYFVYSGIKGDTIVYTKTIIGCPDITETLQVTYPLANKATYDPIVTRMARSLRAGHSLECP